ncbi:MAG: HAD hydrolase-like protein [Ignavibacteriae bacterium]|nr:HAD hydrolase-like protein [Ignavibacteriota bacterium]MCB9214432.1 HAD hydrolase-like protein [Ignavibacteria bacterium]
MTVLFDLDGTLTDSKAGILASINHALFRLGKRELPVEELTAYLGPPLQHTFGDLLDTDDDEVIAAAVAAYRERFAVKGLFENEVYPGIPDLLQELCTVGTDLYVATSKPVIYARQIIEHFNLEKFFRGIYGSEMDGRRSDKEELIAHVIEQENLSAEETWMIGDRRHDVIGGRANDLRTVGVLWGYGSREELVTAGVSHICEEPRGLQILLTEQ